MQRAFFVMACGVGCLLSLAVGFAASFALILLAVLTRLGLPEPALPLALCGLLLYSACRAGRRCYEAFWRSIAS